MAFHLKTDSRNWLESAAKSIKEGKVVAVAYERLFGLAANALDKNAVAEVAAIKDRDPSNAGPRPISVILPDKAALGMVTSTMSPAAKELADRFWPGPLTLIVKALPSLPAPLVSRTGGIGIRVAGPSPAADLARRCGIPLTATSANPAGAPDAICHTDVEGIGGIDIIIEGSVKGPPGSTVVDVTEDVPRILRRGIVSIEER